MKFFFAWNVSKKLLLKFFHGIFPWIFFFMKYFHENFPLNFSLPHTWHCYKMPKILLKFFYVHFFHRSPKQLPAVEKIMKTTLNWLETLRNIYVYILHIINTYINIFNAYIKNIYILHILITVTYSCISYVYKIKLFLRTQLKWPGNKYLCLVANELAYSMNSTWYAKMNTVQIGCLCKGVCPYIRP